jgi:uncharacterized membrane protein YhaH (DUF805 family)
VTSVEAAQLPLRKLLVFSGRSSRQEFWSYLLALWIVVMVSSLALWLAAPRLLIALGGPILMVEDLALWAVAVRRLHDTNQSGYTLLVAVIPLVGLLILLLSFARAGDPGANEYGPNPHA